MNITEARERIATYRSQLVVGKVVPSPAPRYDEVFFKGTEQLDALNTPNPFSQLSNAELVQAIRALRMQMRPLQQELAVRHQRVRSAQNRKRHLTAGHCPSCRKPKTGADASFYRCLRCRVLYAERAAARRARQ